MGVRTNSGNAILILIKKCTGLTGDFHDAPLQIIEQRRNWKAICFIY